MSRTYQPRSLIALTWFLALVAVFLGGALGWRIADSATPPLAPTTTTSTSTTSSTQPCLIYAE